jgi:peroxiredoxin
VKRAYLIIFGVALAALTALAGLLLVMGQPSAATEIKSSPLPSAAALGQPSNTPQSESAPAGTAVATFDGISITYPAWQTATGLDAVMSRLAGQPIPSAEETLDRLINEFLLLRGAGMDDVTVASTLVEARIANLETAWGLTDAQVAAALEQAGLGREALAQRVAHLIRVEQAIETLSARHPDLDAWLAQARQSAQVGVYQPLATAPTVEPTNQPTPTPTSPSPPSLDLPIAPQPGSIAPDFTLSALDGQPLRLDDLHGRPVLLNFWASWCPACRTELSALQAAYEGYGDRVAFLAVDVKEPGDTVAAFVSRFGLTFPILLDGDGAVSDRLYQVRGIPTSLFVGPDGVVSARHVGPLTKADIDRYLTPLLTQPTNQPTNQLAPNFTLAGAGGITVTLGDYRDQSYVVLVFYRGQT